MTTTNKIETEKLLKDQRVIDEINRHLWIESEKAGHDIGFEQAKSDWLKKFSKTWMSCNMPDAIIKERKEERAAKGKTVKATKTTTPQKRRAKSYL